MQAGWSAAYAEHPDVWYPQRGHGPPGHHDLFRPLLVAFSEGRAADLAGARAMHALRGHKGPGLADVVATATRRGTGTLLLSSESLDRAVEEDRPQLVEALGDHDLTVVLTATRPVHRWCSGWQTLVKQGLAQYPVDAAAAHPRLRRRCVPAGWPSSLAAGARPVGASFGSCGPRHPSPTWRPSLAACPRPARPRAEPPGSPMQQHLARHRHRGRPPDQPRRPRARHQQGRQAAPGRAAWRRLQLPRRRRAGRALRVPRRASPRAPTAEAAWLAAPGPRRRGARPARAARRTGPTRPCRSGTPRSAAARPWCPPWSHDEDRETQLWRARQETGGVPAPAAARAGPTSDRPPGGDGGRQRHARLVQRRRAVRRRGEPRSRTAGSCSPTAPTSSTSAASRPGPARPGRWSRRSWTGWSR